MPPPRADAAAGDADAARGNAAAPGNGVARADGANGTDGAARVGLRGRADVGGPGADADQGTEAEWGEGVVRAAGCVLWRGARTGVEIALVHRPKWLDWSHPKGQLHDGEPAATAAVREVREETGMTCALGARLPTAHYRVTTGWKTVDYWLAEALSGTFTPSAEIDRVTWLPPARAHLLLTHPRDRALLATALHLLH